MVKKKILLLFQTSIQSWLRHSAELRWEETPTLKMGRVKEMNVLCEDLHAKVCVAKGTSRLWVSGASMPEFV